MDLRPALEPSSDAPPRVARGTSRTMPAADRRWTGAALVCGGALTILVNAILTPLLPAHVPFAASASSWVFLWRQGASAVAAACLMFGAVGVHLAQVERSGRLGAATFALALLGSALLLATEWNEVFVITDLARRAPGALNALEAGGGMHRGDVGAMIAFGAFTLGWIGLAIATVRAHVLPRRAAWLVILGLFVIPALGAAFGRWGAVAGNAVLGAGWCWLGWSASRTSAHG